MRVGELESESSRHDDERRACKTLASTSVSGSVRRVRGAV
jgi:hypothetical protein